MGFTIITVLLGELDSFSPSVAIVLFSEDAAVCSTTIFVFIYAGEGMCGLEYGVSLADSFALDLLPVELVLGGGGGGAPLVDVLGGQGGGSAWVVGGCFTGLPTSVLGYDGSRPSGAFNKFGFVAAGGGFVEPELVLLWLFSNSGGSDAQESGLLPSELE